MSYQVLARKYRPKNFETLVGQEHVVRALTHALASGRLHHAYLFTGTRGVGKTTLSRILAKSLNCIGPDGAGSITPQPCGVCNACTAIDAGRFVDYIEMDAASNRGVDEMAQLLEQAVYAPSNARFKVYMIDEVHMLTNHAFNSMLKTLEEPPEHVKFILATTDPQKIPVTVLSRCLQFNLKQMAPAHITGHLADILAQETIQFEATALRLLAQAAQGSMRDALSLTDQAIAYAAGEVSLDAVQAMLGALDQTYLIRLLDALAQNDGAGLLAVADEIAARSLSYNNALQDLGTLLHRIALAQSVPAAVPADLPEFADIVRLSAAFDDQEVQLYYQIAVHGRNELGLAPDEYAGFSMTLLRMLAFRPGQGTLDGKRDGTADGAALKPAAMPRSASIPAPPAPVATIATLAPVASARPLSSASGTVMLRTAQAQAQAQALPQAQPNHAAPAAPAAMTAREMTMQALRSGSAGVRAGRPAPTAVAAAKPAAAVPPSLPNAPVMLARPDALPKAVPKAPAPWEEDSSAAIAAPNGEADDAMPSWVTEFSEQSAASAGNVAAGAAVRVAVNVAASAPLKVAVSTPVAEPAPPLQAVPGLDWDGDWPLVAGALPLRGVAQQLAVQAELIECLHDSENTVFKLRVPVDTLRSGVNVEKLAAALSARFQRSVSVDTELGAVRHTASAQAQAQREADMREAEDIIANDPFVQSMMRDLGAMVVPGSITPAAPSSAAP